MAARHFHCFANACDLWPKRKDIVCAWHCFQIVMAISLLLKRSCKSWRRNPLTRSCGWGMEQHLDHSHTKPSIVYGGSTLQSFLAIPMPGSCCQQEQKRRILKFCVLARHGVQNN